MQTRYSHYTDEELVRMVYTDDSVGELAIELATRLEAMHDVFGWGPPTIVSIPEGGDE